MPLLIYKLVVRLTPNVTSRGKYRQKVEEGEEANNCLVRGNYTWPYPVKP
jgi:hypothetical protein